MFSVKDILKSKKTKEKYIVAMNTQVYNLGTLVLEQVDNRDNVIVVDINTAQKLFELVWSSTRYTVINILDVDYEVEWKHNGKKIIMTSKEYGTVSASVHEDDEFDVQIGLDICSLKLATKIIKARYDEFCE